MTSNRVGGRSSGNASRETNSSPTIQLHKLCVHLVGGAGGSQDLVSSHYKSALQLLTSAASHGHPGQHEEAAVVDKIIKSLARGGRERDAAQLSSLHSKLVSYSKDILRNRTSILVLLHSLSGRENSKQPSPFTSSVPHTNRPNQSTSNHSSLSSSGLGSFRAPISSHPSLSNTGISHSTSQPSIALNIHPPIPPKPRSRPSSLYAVEGEPDTRNTLHSVPTVKPSDPAPSEQDLVRELVFVFQGIEGKLIRSENDYYRLDKKMATSSHQRAAVLKLCEVGWLYRQVYTFTEKKAGEVSYGLVGQGFVTALREELTEYYRLIASLENNVREGGVTLLQLGVWTKQPMSRLKMLVEIVNSVGNARGGALSSQLYSFLNQGNPELEGCVATLLSACCRPIYTMLLRWILDGSLEDPHNEFFICGEPSVQGEAIWHLKYSIRKAMIPRFLSMTWTKKILSTGKSINFLNSVCKDSSPVEGRLSVISQLEEMDPATLFRGELDSPLLETIGSLYRSTARHVLDIMFGKFQLMAHMGALRKYLLLGQGDIMRYLLDLLEDELSQPATQLYPHNLAGILETAIRGTNTQYEQQEILERLDVRLLEIQPGDTGWDVFSLDYKVVGPIGVVFTPETMTQYLMLFNTLWRAKRMEWVLSCTWKKLASLHKMARQIKELGPVLHLANLIASEMIHFVHQLAYYITFEVMECGWDALTKQIDTAESLDEVILAHEEFLSTLVARALLDERSRELLNQLRAIYDRILEFQTIANRIHDDAVAEWDARHTRNLLINAKTKAGGYGTTDQIDQQDRERKKTYIKNKLGSARAQLRIVSQSYGDMVRTFLFQLTCSHDESLQFLSFRLDFNENYKKRDSRLSKPLTFSHRRMSGMSGMSTPMMGSQMASSLMSMGP